MIILPQKFPTHLFLLKPIYLHPNTGENGEELTWTTSSDSGTSYRMPGLYQYIRLRESGYAEYGQVIQGQMNIVSTFGASFADIRDLTEKHVVISSISRPMLLLIDILQTA